MDEAHFHRITKALADPRRYELLQRIASRPEVACNNIRCEFPISAATLSHHVKKLFKAGLIDIRKDAKYIHMKLRRAVWKKYLAQLGRL